MDTLLQDVRYALRLLLKAPGFTLVALVTLALGIGANTVMFSIVDAVLLRPLPFRDAERLVVVWERNFQLQRGSHGAGRNVVGLANFVRWREQNRVFEEMAAGIAFPANVNDGGAEPERVPIGIVSPNLFSMLGIQPLLGRTFANDEEQAGKSAVVVLAEHFWKRRYDGNRNVIGRVIQLPAGPTTIVGVMPDSVKFPDAVDLWTPLVIGSQARSAQGRSLTVLARLKPEATVSQAQADMDMVAAQTRAELPMWDANWGANVVPLGEQVVGDVRRALQVLLGAVLFVLLIACANVANLLLAQATAREREIGVRIALGARRGRIVRQLLTESLLLGTFGGGAGLLLAYWSLNPLVRALPKEIPAFRVVEVNVQVLLFAVGLSLLTGIIFGLAPILRVSAASPHMALKEGGRDGTLGHGQHRLRNALVIGEAATALVLLTAAGLMINSVVRLLRVNPGFDPEHVLTMQVNLPSVKYREPQRQIAYFQHAVERIRAVPGVTNAAAISFLPLDGLGSATDFAVDDLPAPKPGEAPVGDVRVITEAYFQAMRIPLLRGRSFDPSLDRSSDAVQKVVINETMAKTLWPGQDPLGKRITMEWLATLHAEVIGVVPDIRLVKLETSNSRSALYWYLPQFPNAFMTFVVRTSGDPLALANTVRREIVAIDPEQPVAKVRSMEQIVSTSVRQPRFTMALLGSFAALALLLAGIGIYGVISYSVTQRTHELGVRMALGAQSRDVLVLVVRHGLLLVAVGLALGVVLAVFVTRLMTTLLFKVRPYDPLTLTGGCALLLTTALVASFVPARRAARVHPMEALRYE